MWQLSNHKSELFYKPSQAFLSLPSLSLNRPLLSSLHEYLSPWFPWLPPTFYPIRTKFFNHLSKRIFPFLRKTFPKTFIISSERAQQVTTVCIHPIHILIELNKLNNRSINPSIDQLQWNHKDPNDRFSDRRATLTRSCWPEYDRLFKSESPDRNILKLPINTQFWWISSNEKTKYTEMYSRYKCL